MWKYVTNYNLITLEQLPNLQLSLRLPLDQPYIYSMNFSTKGRETVQRQIIY